MKNHDGDIRLVCFDLGGVIVRICRSWEEACLRAGLSVRGDAGSEEMKLVRRSITMKCTTGEMEESVWVQQIVEALEGLYSIEEITRIHDAWLIEEYPGWGEVIERLKARGLVAACLSNTVEGHWRRLVNIDESGGARDAREAEYPSILLLDKHFASHLMGIAKPSEGIYRAFEKSVEFSGSEILFFDDLSENVDGARAVGWNAEQVDHTGSPADQVVGILHEYQILNSTL